MTTTADPTVEKKFTQYQVLVIVFLALTQFTVVLDFMVMSPLGDMLMKSMSLTTSQFGFAVSGYAFSAGISGLLTAGFADRFDRKKLLLFFYVGFIAGTLFCGLATTYFMLIAARIITGLFGGVIGSISLAIVADLFPLHQRGRAMGFMQMGFGASQVLGIPISLYLANHWGWQSPFLMIVGLAVIIWLGTMVKLRPIAKHLELKSEKTAVKHLWHTIKQRHYRTGFLLTALLSLGGFMMMPWGSAFAVNNLGVSYEQLPILFMVSGIAALFVMPMVGKLSDKIDKVKIFTVAAISMVVIILVYTNLKPVPFPLIMGLNVLMMTAIMSRIVPAMALVSALPKMQDRGAFMSINSSLQQIAGGIAAGVGGLIVVQKTKTSPLLHYNTLGYLITIIIIANIIQMYRVSSLIKSKKHTEKL
jgi:predicted MFS family arabinose efflux permease